MTINLLNKNEANSDSDSGSQSKVDANANTDPSVTLFPKPDNGADTSNTVVEPLRPQFWERFALAELNHSEWEALCDGCGSCCLIKSTKMSRAMWTRSWSNIRMSLAS